MKGDSFYLKKIVADLKFVIDHTKGMTQTEMEENDLLIDSVMFRIVQVAENGAKLSEAFRMAHPDILWADIRGMRNCIVHNYGIVSMIVVYDTVINHIPKGEIGAEQLRHPRMSRDEIVFGIERFAALDVTTHEGRQKLIDGFINSVFLYDDRIVLNFNGTREARTLTLEEVKSSGSANKPQPRNPVYPKGTWDFCFIGGNTEQSNTLRVGCGAIAPRALQRAIS